MKSCKASLKPFSSFTILYSNANPEFLISLIISQHQMSYLPETEIKVLTFEKKFIRYTYLLIQTACFFELVLRYNHYSLL